MASKHVHIPGKRHLSGSEEFELMKLVFDKFLWLGAAFAGWGMYRMITDADWQGGVWYLMLGAGLMGAFAFLIKREFEQLR